MRPAVSNFLRSAIVVLALGLGLALGLLGALRWEDPLRLKVNQLRAFMQGGAPAQPAPYIGDYPSLADLNVRDVAVEEIYRGLNSPWAFEFVADDELLITEFGGDVYQLHVPSRELVLLGDIPGLSARAGTAQIGLFDVALHPDYKNNGRVYFSHAIDNPVDAAQHALALSQGVIRDNQLSAVEQLLVATPYGESPSNFGGALAFDDTGHLFVATGDRSRRDQAQDLSLLTGKILRLQDNGAAAQGNPFIGKANADKRIWALGVRNPQGLVFDAQRATLYEAEHGPMGGDEVNVIRAGENFGWPVVTYGAGYSTQRIGRSTHAAEFTQPLFYYLPSPAISPITVYRGAMFPEWEGHLLVGALKMQRISKLDVQGELVRSEQRILKELGGRVRDIKIAADGSIYVLIQEDGVIYRVYRDSNLAGLKVRDGRHIYQLACASCHRRGVGNLPALADKAGWEPRLNRGMQALYQSALKGMGDMPAKGFCDNCTEIEIRQAVDYMIEAVSQ